MRLVFQSDSLNRQPVIDIVCLICSVFSSLQYLEQTHVCGFSIRQASSGTRVGNVACATRSVRNRLKHRKWYRPCAPIVAREDLDLLFEPGPDLAHGIPYMSFPAAIFCAWAWSLTTQGRHYKRFLRSIWLEHHATVGWASTVWLKD